MTWHGIDNEVKMDYEILRPYFIYNNIKYIINF